LDFVWKGSAMTRVYLSLGSNLGDREGNLREAVVRLRREFGLSAISSLWETEACGNIRQPPFLNLALGLDVCISIGEFFARCQAIEQILKKEKQSFWGARTIDIDLIFWEHECHRAPDLIMPHPHWHRRNFVLYPLLEIAPLINPGGRGLPFWIRRCRMEDAQAIRPVGKLEGVELHTPSPLTYAEMKELGLTLKGIVAVDNRDGLAREGKIPWNLPEDRSFFREKTRDGILCMGRKTAESLPHSFALEERELWILSRTLSSCGRHSDALVFHHPEEMRDVRTDKVVWICGGREVYGQFLPLCEEVYVTRLLEAHRCDLFLKAFGERWFAHRQIVKHRGRYTIECHRRTLDCNPVLT
jgi:2-amino-4-hydroxy-6-hydroxymethyldihydropteridine diphosphokinase